jgi:hypothetical protein
MEESCQNLLEFVEKQVDFLEMIEKVAWNETSLGEALLSKIT